MVHVVTLHEIDVINSRTQARRAALCAAPPSRASCSPPASPALCHSVSTCVSIIVQDPSSSGSVGLSQFGGSSQFLHTPQLHLVRVAFVVVPWFRSVSAITLAMY